MTLPTECGGWTNAHGVRIPCESGVKGVWICPDCLRAGERAAATRRALADERARRERRQGKTFGPGEGDPFAGFRE